MTPDPCTGVSAKTRLLDGVDLLLLDLDGVLYTGPTAVPSAVEVLAATEVGRVFVTNNASRPPAAVAEHLRELGIAAAPEQVTTSAQAGAALLRRRLDEGATVLAVGGPGVDEALHEVGLTPVRSVATAVRGVLQGFGRDVGWSQLCDATAAIATGAVWVATNTDLTIPTERGTMPGNGTMVAAVATASGAVPLVAAKPEPGIFASAVEAAGSRSPLVVGDRLDTDIAGARAAQIDALLVLTGVSSPADAVAAPEPHRPTHLGLDLRALEREPLTPGEIASHDGRFTVRRASAWLEDGLVRSDVAAAQEAEEGPGGGPDEPLLLLDVCAAACAAAWSAPAGAAPRPDEATERLLERLAELSAPHGAVPSAEPRR